MQCKEKSILTERQYEIACLAARGISRRDIANKLYLSIRTVDAHLLSIYKKFNIPHAHKFFQIKDFLNQLENHKYKITNFQSRFDSIYHNSITAKDIIRVVGCCPASAYIYLKKKRLQSK